ncbi:MAG: helix-turn-helix domain-containing protein [Clostridium butyricum]|nr:MAG TPA: Cro/C1-type HTH DNA-binding domain protein [Caudoviricetes sp.]
MIKLKLHIKLAEYKMNQKELSEQTGISKNTIGAYCNDTCKHIVKDHLDKFCKLFNCDIEDLVEYVNDKAEE